MVILTLSSAIVACKNEPKNAEEKIENKTVMNNTTNENTIEVVLETNDQMKFDQSEIKVPVGRKIVLTLKHVGTMKKEVMGHNFVLLKQGVNTAEFATKAQEAKDNDFIPASESANIVAHTKMIGGGESDTIEFTINEAGTYDFICSFPAHYAMMNGKLIAVIE